MKLLFVSNLYPPHHLGGYEQLCYEVATRLGARGHVVEVLTSTFGMRSETTEPGIYRRLQLESDVYYYRPRQVLRYRSIQIHNQQAVERTVHDGTPDVVVVWGMWKLSKQVAVDLENLAGPRVAYYLANEWPNEPSAHEEYWDNTNEGTVGKVFKSALRGVVKAALPAEWRPYQLRYQHVMSCSAAVRDNLVAAGVPVTHAKVIYHGIDPESYGEAADRANNQAHKQIKAVFVGSLVPHKGTHTAIEAVGRILQHDPSAPITLDILGKGHPDYETQLHAAVEKWNLERVVTFHDPIPRSQLPEFLARFNVLVLPSIWAEPQARISQEAMAAKLVLVGTLTGGTQEILVDGVNGLAFPPDDANCLAKQLMRLADDYALRLRLAQAGWETVRQNFTMSGMLDKLEVYLQHMLEQI
jgi:glycogen synthase